MKKPQWITAGAVVVLTVFLYVLTVNDIFGYRPKKTDHTLASDTAISVDTIIAHAKETLKPEQLTRLAFLEKAITRGDVHNQQIEAYHQLAHFWADSAHIFEPYAWYTAEAARLENSQKSLTFAAHLFLNNLRAEGNPDLKKWKALQAKDLFERSLKINPDNDSTQVGLGAVLLFGNIGSTPMEGILKIRQVAERDSTNIYAQMMLGQASVMSRQFDKAISRFLMVIKMQPQNLEAVLSLAEAYEQKSDRTNAIMWYKKSLALINNDDLKNEVETRINELK
ncbi:MAG: hypothetical protein ICV66_04340 [Chitinophagaceae bacterium]|nr:hypothetical protein [Chitinophagaceae bacterium]